ncbi:efflux ABC transporter, permease protein [Actinomyces johnsonii F0542]|uniref:Efflux ABC transporter, permease protein n=1 Tax=Actinomyces johnsonii F0542 TaxID=1321818 RepID=U1S2A6_9ACTO|nr:ABC transporter permease [Actinomyces johnsonii]ERH24787.1 efflux ABC transporter, permease protein [Actinomyces johnsonii F0542]
MPALLDLRRTAAALVAVAMSAALIAFAFIISDSLQAKVTENARASVGDADVVVLAGSGDKTTNGRISEQAVQKVSALAGVASVRPYVEGGIQVADSGEGQGGSLIVLDVPKLTGGTRLVEGRLPQGDNEIAVSPSVLERQQNVKVSSTLTVKASEDASPTTVTVVGVVQPAADITRGDTGDTPYIFAPGEAQAAMGLPSDPAVLYVTAQTGTSDKELLSSVTEALAATQPGAQAYTASDIITMRAASSDATASKTLTLLQVIAPVCVVVSGIVIATTFTTLMARQTRQIGLLRCVGATRRQIVGSVLRTALLTGLAGSVAGAVVGAVVAVPVIRSGLIEGVEPRHLTISWTSFALATLVGTVVTLVSVLRPARQASRVSPLVALTGQTAGQESLSRRRIATAVAGVVIAVLGLGLIQGGVAWRVLQIIGAGAVLAVLGIILALPLLVVGTSRLIGLICGQMRRPILHLATRNLARNPGRAAATTASLLVSVAVAAAMSSGLSSLSSSLQAYVGYNTPIDITVGELAADQDPSSTVAKIAAVDGVESVVSVPWINVKMTGSRQNGQEESLTIAAVDKEKVSPVLRSQEALETLDDHTLVLDRIYNIPDGTTVTLTGPAGSTELTVRVKEGLDAAVTPAAAQRLIGNTSTASILWVRTSGDGSDQAPVSAVREALSGSGLYVADSQETRASFTDQVRQVSIAIGAMLIFTLLIALSGLANTFNVSVLERTRELGVLRATGAQRSEIRRLLIAEAVLSALLGGTIGVLLGCGVGIAGASAVLNTDSGNFLTIEIPWLTLTLVGILLAAATVGVVASLRPAENASRIPPVQALAQD